MRAFGVHMVLGLCAIASLLARVALTASVPSSVGGKPVLKRQNANRWTRLDEIARAEIKSATRQFLDARNHVSATRGVASCQPKCVANRQY